MGVIANSRQALRESPKEIFNWYLYACTAIISLAGVAKGFDEGNIASIVVMATFRNEFGVAQQDALEYSNTKGWIVSITTAGATFGCLACVYLNNALGRNKSMQLFTLIYIAGVLGQTFSGGSLAGLYASRVVTGFGIGGTTVIPSVYLSEIAPKAIRGLITVQYAACQQLGVVLGFFINYGITKNHAGTNLQWQLPTALQILPAVIWGLGLFLLPESPRWLLSVNKRTQALDNLQRIRKLPHGHPEMQAEIDAIDNQLQKEMDVTSGTGPLDMARETFATVENRRRFFLAFMCHTFGQWSGANAITQYLPTIFGYLGIAGDELKFLATGIYGIVKLTSVVIFSLVIVDFVGRRRSLMTGICLQMSTLTFLAGYLGGTNGMSAAAITASSVVSKASYAAIVATYIHAVGWSIGWFSVPYLVGSEIFPIRIRSFNVSVMMALHWAFYFGCSRAMPSLLVATHRYGAFVFFATICFCSLIYVFFAMPETAGRSLESLDSIFQRPWYTVWKIAYVREEEPVDDLHFDEKKHSIERIERV